MKLTIEFETALAVEVRERQRDTSRTRAFVREAALLDEICCACETQDYNHLLKLEVA